jgi:hypothetical protein
MRLLYVDWQGVWFHRQGDEIGWLWPWRRLSGYPWLSLGAEGGFHSLKEMDAFWASIDAELDRQWEALKPERLKS